jgi:GNAT superfamily N-acetyltransferase
MAFFVSPSSLAEQEEFCSMSGLSPLSPELIARHRPDAQWLLRGSDGSPAARCSLWWSAAPRHEGQRLGYLGHYAARDLASSTALLNRACRQLAEHADLAVAPIDGNTWNRYRLLTERGPEPLFFLEPDNPDDWPAHFTTQGFIPLAGYYSALNADLNRTDPRTAALRGRLAEEELRALYPLALSSFAHNFLYTPISEEDFLAQYLPVRPYLRAELVFIAEKDRQPVGFLLGVPDLLQARRGEAMDTFIIKTVAVHPEQMGQGLGTLLVAHAQEEAGRLGYRRAIHALMHEANSSRRISNHTARTLRRYTLFSRPLGNRP